MGRTYNTHISISSHMSRYCNRFEAAKLRTRALILDSTPDVLGHMTSINWAGGFR